MDTTVGEKTFLSADDSSFRTFETVVLGSMKSFYVTKVQDDGDMDLL